MLGLPARKSVASFSSQKVWVNTFFYSGDVSYLLFMVVQPALSSTDPYNTRHKDIKLQSGETCLTYLMIFMTKLLRTDLFEDWMSYMSYTLITHLTVHKAVTAFQFCELFSEHFASDPMTSSLLIFKLIREVLTF